MKSMALSAIAVTPIRSDMTQYTYHYDDMDKDSRPPSCYQLKYRGVTYWSCYRIHMRDWLNEKYALLAYGNKRDLKNRSLFFMHKIF